DLEEIRPRVRKCVGNPPRQTEDPQSPPCVPFFEGNNGGETSLGVTKDEVIIAWPNLVFFGPEPQDVMQLRVDHFNRRYEFYGRKIVLAEFEIPTFAAPDPPTMVADAVRVHTELKAFASLGYGAREGSENHYYEELARRGVVSVSTGKMPIADEARMSRFHPHWWSWEADIGETLALAGDFVCSTLAGRPPVGGAFQDDGNPLDPGATLRPEQRKFGIISTRSKDGVVAPSERLTDALDACGADYLPIIEDDANALQPDNVVLQLRNAQVTSVMCLCADLNQLRSSYMPAATNQNFFPEWVTVGYGASDIDNSFQPGVAPPEQAKNVLGITTHDRWLPRQQMPWYWALRESDPNRDHPGQQPYFNMLNRYSQMLNLASGIQLAGPNLTPESFAQGLQMAKFPNPGAGDAPQFQARIDFRRSHFARATAAMYWYSPSEGGVIDPSVPGSLCVINQARQYAIGAFPTEQQAWFQTPCVH
ncbi:MAG: hypothetical protein ACI867_001039, partial [Glaciecola sp.]